MAESPGTDAATEVVRAAFRHYRAQDRAAAFALYADDFTFSSPQDDHIDKAAFFARCFPTADRFDEQRLLYVVPAGAADGEGEVGGDGDGEVGGDADGEVVLAYYEYELSDGGGRFRNVEAITVRDGLVREVRVFFGGRV
ncbi:hypothetical protein ACIQNG_20800 [Streptomyces sp. NPDC091377]|uniref:hypothetical protein n=1 Tax=unclassified Streptomyces TaxID=2593676 RepID=UPI0038083D2B